MIEVFHSSPNQLDNTKDTHRVALDWLFDRINLDPKIHVKYVDTKHQLADILTKGNFTRDEWNNLLHLINISRFSSLCCAQNFSLTSCTRTMAKRMQEQEGDNRSKLSELLSMLGHFTQGHWSCLGPGSEKKWYGTHAHKTHGEWDKTVEGMMFNFAERGHPVFRASSTLERGEL